MTAGMLCCGASAWVADELRSRLVVYASGEQPARGREGTMDEHQQVMGFARQKNAHPVPLDPARTALCVIDMQRVFTRPEEALCRAVETASEGISRGYLERVSEVVVPAIGRLLDAFRRHGSPIFFTAIGTESGAGGDLPHWLRGFDQLGLATLGERVWPPVGHTAWQIDEALAPRPGEPVLNKLSAGTFATTGLEQRLRHLGIQTVVVTGVVTDVCVSTTAREAADRGFDTVMVSDACTTLSEVLHRASLESFSMAFGWVRSAEEVIAALQSGLEEQRERARGARP
jgi:biuret amidohydrolase